MDASKSYLQSLVVTRLQPSHLLTDADGNVTLNSPSPALVVVTNGRGILSPDELELDKNSVVLIPSAYPCAFRSTTDSHLELTAVDVSFTFHNLDVSLALPKEPSAINGAVATDLMESVCLVCNLPDDHLGMQQAANRMAAGYRMAANLTEALGLDSNRTMLQHRDPGVKALVNYLNANYHLPLTVEDIAADCKISRRQVFKIAARLNKTTPMRLLKKIRLEKSLDHLQRPDLEINEIAGMVGFVNAKNFSREFKRYYGMLPRQHRQQSQVGSKVANLVGKADANLKIGVPKRASILYLKAIESAHPWTNLDELLFKAGLALRRAGNPEKSDECWGKVSTLYYRLLINFERCESLNKSIEHLRIIKLLKHCYQYGDDAVRDGVISRLGDWMLQCAMTEGSIATKRYSEYAKELVHEYPVLENKLAKSLYATGQFMDVARYCSRQDFHVSASYRAAGLYREHLERYSHMRKQCGLIHLRMEDHATVLERFGDVPELCAQALLQSGRAEMVVERYPEQCVKALLTLGRYQEVLDGHPDDHEGCMWALTMLGRHEEAMARASAFQDLKANLFIYNEKIHPITSSTEFDRGYRRAANLLNAIHELEKNQLDEAMEVLETVAPISDPTGYCGHGFFHADLLVPCIRHLLPNARLPKSRWPEWRSHFGTIIRHYRYYYVQQQWYAMRLILDEIDDDAYLAQPNCRDGKMEIDLIRGIKADLHGDASKAKDYYRAYFELTSDPSEIYYLRQWFWPVNKAFIRWRLSQLEA